FDLRIAADVLDPSDVADLALESRRPLVQLRRVGVLKGELIETARALLTAQIDRRLVDHVDADPRHLRPLRPLLGDDLVDVQLPLCPWLQLDRDPSGVEAPAAGPSSYVVAEAQDVRILSDDVGNLHLMANHLVEPDSLNGFGADLEAALVLARQESFRNESEEVHRAGEQHDGNEHRHGAEAETQPEGPIVQSQPALEHALEGVVEPAVLHRVRRLQKAAAEHRREADRDEP